MILGIDIGLKGAIALVEESGELIAIHDMPCLADGPKGRSAINAPLLADILGKTHAVHAYVEHVGPRPGEGAVGGFAFGRCKGVIEGVLAAHGVPVTFLTPPTWKKNHRHSARSRRGQRRGAKPSHPPWPSHAELFAKVKDDGRAEAALIAIAGIKRESSA